MLYYHSCNVKDLENIKRTGYLRAPLFVYRGDVTPYNPARDAVITLDLRGFNLKKDPHPYAPDEGYYIVSENVPVSRIRNIDYHWGHSADELGGEASDVWHQLAREEFRDACRATTPASCQPPERAGKVE